MNEEGRMEDSGNLVVIGMKKKLSKIHVTFSIILRVRELIVTLGNRHSIGRARHRNPLQDSGEKFHRICEKKNSSSLPTSKWLSTNPSRLLLTPPDSKLLSVEDRRVRPTTTKERDWSPNTRPSTTLQSTDWLSDSPTETSLPKLSLLPSLVTLS